MSKIPALDMAVTELNKKLDELHGIINSRGQLQKIIASVAQGMHESLGVLLDKIQSVVEIAYLKDSRCESLEALTAGILDEINKLILLKGQLHAISEIEPEH